MLNEIQRELLLNLILEKMQEIAECKNSDMRKILDGYKKELHAVYKLIVDMK